MYDEYINKGCFCIFMITSIYPTYAIVAPDQFVSSDVCLGRGCQGVSLVARKCSRGFGDESEP